MKKTIISALVLCIYSTIFYAQTPLKMSYQAVVRDTNNYLVHNKLLWVRISILADSVNGEPVFAEIHNVTTNKNALMTLQIGAGTPLMESTLADIVWGEHNYFLKTEIDLHGDGIYNMSDVQQFMAVPYAFHSLGANYSDTAVFAYVSSNVSHAAHSDSAVFSCRADTADYNKLLNKPSGVNTGDILYWEEKDSSWHVVPAGSSGQILQLDTNTVPSWNSIDGDTCKLATVVTDTLFDCMGETVTVRGHVAGGGGSPFVVSGFCWSTKENPTLSSNYSINGVGVSSFSHKITDLNFGTKYYVRAYAMNSAGISYGTNKVFKTLDYPVVVTDNNVTTISSISAYCGGNVTSDGGASITQRGICWNTKGIPTLSDSCYTSDGSGKGTFTSFITGLLQGQTYYVRAYAKNIIGTAYGSQVSFKTLAVPMVITTVVGGITAFSAVSGGTVTDSGGVAISECGIVWNSDGEPTKTSYIGMTSNGNTVGEFTDSISNLTPGQKYYVRAYATNVIGTSYGNELSFYALPVIPTVTTNIINNISSDTATAGGEITDNGGAVVTECGVCWNIVGSPTISDSHVVSGNGDSLYSCLLGGLKPGTIYYVRAYAINSAGVAYGSERTFKTDAVLPTVETDTISEITTTTAVSGGVVVCDGGDSVTLRGVTWATFSAPTIKSFSGITKNGSDTGVFKSALSKLTPGMTYYVRAYATNSVGTAYGPVHSFAALPTLPNVATSATVTDITGESATVGGIVHYSYGAKITECGICWNTTGNPSVADNFHKCGEDAGSYTYSIPNLKDSTTYYARVYAINSLGTSYGAVVSFTTRKLPKVFTDPITDIKITDAKSGVRVESDFYIVISECGVCWSTSATPTIKDRRTIDGTGIGSDSYSSFVYNLNETTTYYVRAYATSELGTAYGQTLSFTTLAYQSCHGAETVTDIDGNIYKTIQIGTQCWMRENLRTTRYANGTKIPEGVITTTAMAYRYNPGGGSAYVPTRGYLYNWVALLNGKSSSDSIPSGVQGPCPNGWHIPSSGEWNILKSYIKSQPSWMCGNKYNGRAVAANTGWNLCGWCYDRCFLTLTPEKTPSCSRNSSGFSALPSGFYNVNGNSASSGGQSANYWSCTDYDIDVTQSYIFSLDYTSFDFTISYTPKYYGNAIRCIKD